MDPKMTPTSWNEIFRGEIVAVSPLLGIFISVTLKIGNLWLRSSSYMLYQLFCLISTLIPTLMGRFQ